jgi:addiction module RelE/StbE family toxin
MDIEFHRKFKKMYRKQNKKVQEKFNVQLDRFINNPFDEKLNNHTLGGDLKAYRSIDVTGDIRAWYKPYKNTVVFVKIGSHSELYG